MVRFQGPQANGMPELHKLTPTLALLQDRGHRIALLTDGRMSGASGRVPAAIHVTPGSRRRRRDCANPRWRHDHGWTTSKGRLDVLLSNDELDAREVQTADLSANHTGMGRDLFGLFRNAATSADLGAGVL